ncbi:2-oxo acid dehydrogenase subunit E2 [Microbacterium deminutum]|uniref:Dihydrolipoamide acetyltransferase component of pyruvate dehydrogenase complex n=1 Tax=Microbacterium deminutum TaxID=344164 RepID=A0ABP5CN88_9MICO
MATVVRMPSVMAGAREAALQTWLVAVGDRVSAGQAIAEIETEKAVFEHEVEASGTVAALLVAPGESVAVGAPIAVLADEGEDPAVAAGAAVGASPGAPDAVRAPDAAPPVATPHEPTPARLFASPLVRRLAQERGIDLAAIRGSGPGGRIVRRDVDALAAAARPDSHASVAETSAEFTDVPHTPMRRAIARRLTESTTTVPHFFLAADCRVDALLELRRSVNVDRPEGISVNDFVVKAVGAALRAVPEANAIWMPDASRRFAHADIGVAVAIDGGLVTPVVRGVDRMPLGELSAAIRDVASRARAGRLRQHELEGGSFSVSNLGMHGVREFSAIINPPHAGILAIGAAARQPVVDREGGLGVATVMTVTLSADHRVLDGALAARWLGAFVEFVENPVRMLI